MGKARKSISEATGGDLAHSVAKGVPGEIPLAGGLAAELFGYLVAPPLEKHMVEWLEKIAERLRKLESNGLAKWHCSYERRR